MLGYKKSRGEDWNDVPPTQLYSALFRNITCRFLHKQGHPTAVHCGKWNEMEHCDSQWELNTEHCVWSTYNNKNKRGRNRIGSMLNENRHRSRWCASCRIRVKWFDWSALFCSFVLTYEVKNITISSDFGRTDFDLNMKYDKIVFTDREEHISVTSLWVWHWRSSS